MKLHSPKWIPLVLGALVLLSPFDLMASTTEFIKKYRFKLEDIVADRKPQAPLLVILESPTEGLKNTINVNLLKTFIRLKLGNRGIPTQFFTGPKYQSLYTQGKLSLAGLFADKLVVEFRTLKKPFEEQPQLQMNLTLLEFNPNSSPYIQPHVLNESENRFGQVQDSSLQSRVTQRLSAELNNYAYILGRRKTGNRLLSPKPSKMDHETVSYQVEAFRLYDRITVRGGLFTGLPRPLHLKIGLLGPESWPIYTELGGMVLGNTQRWAQVDAGYLLRSQTGLHYGFGISVLSLNVSAEVRVSATEVQTQHSFAPYVGPHVRLEWKDFQLQTGLFYRMGSLPLAALENEVSHWTIGLQVGFFPGFEI